MAVTKLELKSYKSDVHNNWCPGCGDFGILTAMQMALFQLKIEPHNVALQFLAETGVVGFLLGAACVLAALAAVAQGQRGGWKHRR